MIPVRYVEQVAKAFIIFFDFATKDTWFECVSARKQRGNENRVELNCKPNTIFEVAMMGWGRSSLSAGWDGDGDKMCCVSGETDNDNG